MSYSPSPAGGSPYSPGPASPGPPSPGGSSGSDSDEEDEPDIESTGHKRAEGPLGQAELLLEGLAEDLNTLQTRAETVHPPRAGGESLIQSSVRAVIDKLAQLDELAPSLDFLIPMEILEYIDDGRNPEEYTKDMVEMTVAENQFTNGKVHAIESYLGLLSAGLSNAFPEIADLIQPAALSPNIDDMENDPMPAPDEQSMDQDVISPGQVEVPKQEDAS